MRSCTEQEIDHRAHAMLTGMRDATESREKSTEDNAETLATARRFLGYAREWFRQLEHDLPVDHRPRAAQLLAMAKHLDSVAEWMKDELEF